MLASNAEVVGAIKLDVDHLGPVLVVLVSSSVAEIEVVEVDSTGVAGSGIISQETDTPMSMPPTIDFAVSPIKSCTCSANPPH